MSTRRASRAEELPEGFRYRAEFLTEAEERELLDEIARLEFQAFEFHGYTAKRRVVEYGWEYDFGSREASAAPPIPGFLLPLRERAAAFAGLSADSLVEAVVTEYPSGAPIGWHRDVPQFETIVGISLGSAGRMRFKPYRAEGKLVSAILEPRSIYVLAGPARWRFQHSMPAVEAIRYSITFRTLREKRRREAAC
jgi:alkylated DNA repair dioxygenase AlkB